MLKTIFKTGKVETTGVFCRATTFLPQFESCVEAGGLGMMCSFNSIRGVPACANHRAMQTWAKGQWGFPGYIVSDQGAAMGILTDHKCACYLHHIAYSICHSNLAICPFVWVYLWHIVLPRSRYASTLPEAAAFAVSGGLDLEDANSAAETVFGGAFI